MAVVTLEARILGRSLVVMLLFTVLRVGVFLVLSPWLLGIVLVFLALLPGALGRE
jgi:hypothetical protein